MRRNSGSKLTCGITVATLLWFVDPIGAIPLESWDDKIPNAGTRFKVLAEFGGQAVLDKETQLVWEQSPATIVSSWATARLQCTSRTTGGRKGWRLPSVHELASLIDPSVASPGPTLPSGHPFTNIQSHGYWSATTDAEFTTHAFIGGLAFAHVASWEKTTNFYFWCVRGGMNADQY